MTTGRRLGTTLLFLLTTSVAISGGFKNYPDATPYTPPDTEANRQFTAALRPGVTIKAWLTQDTFEQVVGFYRAIGKEYKPPNAPAPAKLPSGELIQRTFLIFDGAPDPASSTQWARIQRPFVVSASQTEGAPQQQEVRDVTEIVLTETKLVAKPHDSRRPHPASPSAPTPH